MKNAGWVVAVVVALAALGYYFWPSLIQAPAQSGTATTTPQEGAQLTERPDMPGTWRSDKDAKFTREIRTDGTIIDRYEGEPSAGLNGEWSAVADVSAEEGITAPAASLAGLTVIKVVWEGGVETTYFAVSKLDERTMTTVDLTGRGEVTSWTRQ